MVYLSKLFFPKKCPVCGERIPFISEYCQCTRLEVRSISEDFCEHCGADSDNCRCGDKNSIYLEHITAPYIYTGIIRSKILSFKFQNERKLAKDFAYAMALRFSKVFPDAKADVVTFVPMTEAARKETGFNQSELLAGNVSKSLFINCEELLEKTVETKRQHELPAAERMNNLDNAFCLNSKADVKGKTVILCDDIKTTGTTLKKCSEVLFENGARDVFCLCIAVSDYQQDLNF